MKAAVWRQTGRFDIEEVPAPAPAADEVVIKIEYCGVCGTDIHRAWTHGEMAPGVVIGHEYCGRVTMVGSAAAKWKAGDRVVCASGIQETGSAAAAGAESPRQRFTPRLVARTGAPGTVHQGGFAEYKRIRAANILGIPDSIDDLTATLIEPCAIAVHAVERAQIGAGERVGIIGLGPIGLLVAQVARAAGALEVYGVDPSAVRRSAGLEVGCTAAYAPNETDAVEALVSVTDGGPDVVFDCAAAATSLDDALTATRAHGRVVLVGISWDRVTVTPVEWIGRNVEMRSMYAYSRAHCEAALKLIAKGAIHSAEMIRPEWIFPLEGIHEAFERSYRAELVKAVIRP